MKKNKGKKNKKKNKEKDIMTEEELEEYLCGLYGFGEIIGYTPGGVPYGIPIEMYDEDYEVEIIKLENDDDDDIPF